MPNTSLIVGSTTISVPAWVVSEDRGSHSVPVATFTGDRARANAELFDAAPDLLAACEVALAELFSWQGDEADLHPSNKAQAILRAAIAKAKGGVA